MRTSPRWSARSTAACTRSRSKFNHFLHLVTCKDPDPQLICLIRVSVKNLDLDLDLFFFSENFHQNLFLKQEDLFLVNFF